MTLLVVTPTLGNSKFLRLTVTSVKEHACKFGWTVQHVIIVPLTNFQKIYHDFGADSLVLVDSGKNMYEAINQGLVAGGQFDWWTYLNDDDVLSTGFGRLLGKAQQMPNESLPAVIYGDVLIINEIGAMKNRVTRLTLASLMKFALAGRRSPLNQQGSIASANTLSESKLLNGHYKYAADYEFYCRCASEGVRFHYVAGICAAFRVHGNQLSTNLTPFLQEIDSIKKLYPVSRFGRIFAAICFFLGNLPIYAERLIRARSFGIQMFQK